MRARQRPVPPSRHAPCCVDPPLVQLAAAPPRLPSSVESSTRANCLDPRQLISSPEPERTLQSTVELGRVEAGDTDSASIEFTRRTEATCRRVVLIGFVAEKMTLRVRRPSAVTAGQRPGIHGVRSTEGEKEVRLGSVSVSACGTV